MNLFERLLVKIPLVQRLLADARRQGGIEAFPLAQKDILETVQDDIDRQAQELAKVKVAELLSIVDDRKIVTFSPTMKAIFIGGERADDGRLASLKAEAEYFTQSDLWHILWETPKQLAQKALFNDDGDSKVVHTKGRAILYTLDTQKRILDTFLSYSQK